MEVEKSHEESAAATPPLTSCGWKMSKDGSFISNLKEQFHDFVNTPMADHKLCFKNTIDEMVENFRKEVHGLKGAENSATIQSPPAEENQ
ncbi:hypothetical protein RND71_011838 [Anisodus tanguticus]|uniref:Uncharacterized protein n=1 Tax=Anisodus tanguticus TaxID=243964 RepID=A0AAE1SFQ1_9SOLA|nr:hypothetical protein RND71_011838 [Anisodus tanguticus]